MPNRSPGMLIRLSIVRAEPLTGSAATGTGAPVHFLGWMDLLRSISELVGAAATGDDGPHAGATGPTERTEGS